MRLVAIGGSDAGIQAALRGRELDPSAEVTVVLADAYPNYSICGSPYYVSGEVPEWHTLAHRTIAELNATGITLRLDTVTRQIDVQAHRITVSAGDDGDFLESDALVLATGALPISPPIAGLEHLGPREGVHLLHPMGDTFALMRTLQPENIRRAVIVGAGCVGLEISEAPVARGTQVEQLPKCFRQWTPSSARASARSGGSASLSCHGTDFVREVLTSSPGTGTTTSVRSFSTMAAVVMKDAEGEDQGVHSPVSPSWGCDRGSVLDRRPIRSGWTVPLGLMLLCRAPSGAGAAR